MLFRSAIAVIRGRDDVSIANVLGSNLMNTIFITGSVASVFALPIEKQVLTYDSVWLVGATVGMWALILLFKGRVPRWMGGLFLACYVYYIVSLL